MKSSPRAAATACALLLLASACARAPIRARPALVPAAPAAVEGEVYETGIASWYGGDFNGRDTANGEVFDMRKLTAAHPRLPFHTIVEVENMENGRRVLVRVNDRGPFLKGRIIDLSREAARRLDMADKGIAEVSLRIVRSGNAGDFPALAREPGTVAGDPGRAASCYVQAGAFALRENAEDLLLSLGEIFPRLAFRVVQEDGLYKVISPELEADACRDVLRTLSAHRLQGFIREPDAPGNE